MYDIATVFPKIFANALSDIFSNFGVHWQLLLIQSINFLCVIGILYHFAFKPVLKTMDDRRKKIEDGIRYADEMKGKLENADIVSSNRLKEAKEEAKQIIECAKVQAKEYADSHRAEIDKFSKKMIDDAKKSIADEKYKMLQNLKSEVKVLVADISAKILRKEMTQDDRRKYLESSEIEI